MLRRLARFGLVLLSAAATAQTYLNLDFETVVRGRLRGWSYGTAGYEMAVDAAQFVSGKQSWRIRGSAVADTAIGTTARLLPLDLVRGKKVKASGWIKTEGVAPGYAAVWMRADGATGMIHLDNMFQFAPRGTTGWARYEFERDVSADAVQVVFGVFLSGRGTAWFDNLQIEIDGKPLEQVEPYIGEPTAEQLDWIQKNAIPFRTPDAGSGLDDLMPLKEMVGKARIVALGEATHGTSEFFRMKHRLLEFLATEMGFTIFSIEANMPEAYRVNDYVLTGRGNAKDLLKGMYFWTWNTQEVLDMIEWMRAFNASGRGRVQFTGNDMQYGPVAGGIVREFIQKADPAFLPTLDEAYRVVAEASYLRTQANQFAWFHLASAWAARTVRETMEANFEKYLKRTTLAEADWAVQNARVVEQSAYLPLAGSGHRDEMMALNTKWIMDRNPGAKAVLWAHNYHVSRVTGAQGSYLGKWYGAEYMVIGFAFNEGRYNAVNQATGRLGPADAVVSYPGTVEYTFHATGIPQFILSLRNAKTDNAGAWLLAEVEMREVGAVVTDGYSVRPSLTKDFDALIYFDKTTPSALLPF